MRVCGDGAGLQWPRMTPLGRGCAVCQHSFYLYVSVFVPYGQTWASLASCIYENTETLRAVKLNLEKIVSGIRLLLAATEFPVSADLHSYHRCVDLTMALNEQLQDAVHPDTSFYLLFSLCHYVMDMHRAEPLAWLAVCALTTSGTVCICSYYITTL